MPNTQNTELKPFKEISNERQNVFIKFVHAVSNPTKILPIEALIKYKSFVTSINETYFYDSYTTIHETSPVIPVLPPEWKNNFQSLQASIAQRLQQVPDVSIHSMRLLISAALHICKKKRILPDVVSRGQSIFKHDNLKKYFLFFVAEKKLTLPANWENELSNLINEPTMAQPDKAPIPPLLTAGFKNVPYVTNPYNAWNSTVFTQFLPPLPASVSYVTPAPGSFFPLPPTLNNPYPVYYPYVLRQTFTPPEPPTPPGPYFPERIWRHAVQPHPKTTEPSAKRQKTQAPNPDPNPMPHAQWEARQQQRHSSHESEQDRPPQLL